MVNEGGNVAAKRENLPSIGIFFKIRLCRGAKIDRMALSDAAVHLYL